MPNASTWWTFGAIAAGLLAIHTLATSGTWALSQARLDKIGITPARTLADGYRHLWAGFFHTTPGHILFNLAVFAVAFPFAAGTHPGRTFGLMYAIGPLSVFILHLVLVRPMAAAGNSYALEAMARSLVGFSVMAYSAGGMAVAKLGTGHLPIALAVAGLVLAFELFMGLGRHTGPVVFVYHLAGFGVGALVRIVRPGLWS